MQHSVGFVALAVLLLLAGCSGSGSVASSETRATPTVSTPTNGTVGSPVNSTGSPDSHTVDPSRVVDFEALNSQQQSAFREATRDEVGFVPNSTHIHEPDGYDLEHLTPFKTYDYVRYDGELYEIRLQQGKLYASYGIQASVGSPSDDETVIDFGSLPEALQDEIRTAITEGEYYAPMGKWRSLPTPLQDADYVRYENRTYEMEYVVGDTWAEILTVEKA